MTGKFFLALVAAIVIGLGLGAGAGAVQERMNGKGGSATTAAAQQSQTASSDSGQGALANQAGGQAGTFGTIENLSSSGFVLVAQSGRVQVATGSETKVLKMGDAKVADLKVGDSIVATGEQQADGTLAAASVQVGNMEGVRVTIGGMAGQSAQGARAQAQGSGQRSGQQGAPSDRVQGTLAQRGSAVVGAIESISGDTITAKTQTGASSKVKVSSATAVTKLVDGTLQDIKTGQTVAVTGERDSSGTVKATSIQLMQSAR